MRKNTQVCWESEHSRIRNNDKEDRHEEEYPGVLGM